MKRITLVAMAAGVAFMGAPVSGAVSGGGPDAVERQAMVETLRYALENNPNGEESYWTNPDTGRSGAIVPVNRIVDATGLICREYISTFFTDGEEVRKYGTACRKSDGRWMVILDRGATGHAEVISGPGYVYVYRDPCRYHYPWVWYAPSHYPHRIFFSFIFSSRSGYFHVGNFYPGHYQDDDKKRPVHHHRKTSRDQHEHRDGRRILHGIRSPGQGGTSRSVPLKYRGDGRTERNPFRDDRDGHRARGREPGDHDHASREGHSGRDGGHGRIRSRMGEMKPGEFGKLPEVNNIHREQGVDVWAPIRSDWGYKENRQGTRESFGSKGVLPRFKRGHR